MWLSKKSQTIMNSVEEKLWKILISRIPLSGTFEYDEQSLRDMISKETIESQFVSYIDKLDGFMACFHELVAGNKDFLEPFFNYIKIFQDIKKGNSLPSLSPLFKFYHKGGGWWEYFDPLCDIDTILEQSKRIDKFFWKCNTTEKMKSTIEDDLGFPMYKLWKFFTKVSAVNIDSINTRILSWEQMLTERWRELWIPKQFQ